MSNCGVPLCDGGSSRGFAVFKLPKSDEIRDKWLQFLQNCGKKTDAKKKYRICEIHFDPNDVIQGFTRKVLRAEAVPSFNKNQVRK